MPEDEDGPAFRSGGHAYEPQLAPSPAPAPPSTDTVAVADGEALKRGEVVEFKLATWGENWTPALSPPKRARVSRSQGGELTLEMDEGSPLEIPQRELRELRRVIADSQDSAALAEPEALEEAQAPPASSVAGRTRSRSASDAALPAPKRRAPAPPLSPISSPSVSEVRKGSKSSRKRPRKAAGGAAAAPAPVRRRTKTTPAVKGGPNDTTAAPAPAVEEKKSPKRRRARKKNGPKSPVPFSPTLPPVDAALEAKKAKLLELAK